MSAEAPVAMVTGGTKGIGLAISEHLARTGHTVVMNYRSDESQAAAALAQVRALHPGAELLRADVSEPDQVDAMFRTVRTEFGTLDHFVSNAGITADGFAVMMSHSKWGAVVDTNLTGAFACLRAAARTMAARRSGSLVAVASTSAVNAPAGQANYAASKAGLVAAVRVLAKELGPYGVRANAVLPGFVDTGMTRTMPEKDLNRYLAGVPLGRIGTCADVAPTVAFLLSDAAAYITGSTVVVDGGLTC
ncbi:3-oxoacyl-[acyl-carrier-protein] reductase [Microlunatus lacustris]